MATIWVEFTFSTNSGDVTDTVAIEIEEGLEDIIDEAVNELLEENDDFIECTGREIYDWDTDYNEPSDFDTLNEFAEFVVLCEKHGEAFALRYADRSDLDDRAFQDQYCGCWESEEKFVQHELDSCYEVPSFLEGHIDYESLAHDWMMDYSTYEGDDGIHVFRD